MTRTPARKWLIFSALPLALLLVGCPKNKDVVDTTPPPAEVESVRPSTDVETTGDIGDAMDPTEVQPELSLQELQAQVEQQGLLGDVFFDFDQADLSSEARQRLARNAEFMNDNPNLEFTIEGHCDERGTSEYNLALGQERATTTADYLSSLGVQRNRLRTLSFGEERPFCVTSNESCWQKNRRARFVITGGL